MNALTKILIVLQLVFAVACAVLIVLMVSKQENYKVALDGANTARIGLAAQAMQAGNERDAARSQLVDVTRNFDLLKAQKSTADSQALTSASAALSEKISLESKNSQLQAQNSALAASLQAANASLAKKDEELGGLRPQVSKLTVDNSSLSRAKTEVDNQLRSAEQAIRKLQEELQLLMAAPKVAGSVSPASGGDGQVTSLTMTPTSSAVNARIDVVQNNEAGRTMLKVPLGTRDGVSTSTRLMISRNNTYIGEAVLTNVSADSSAGTVTSVKAGETVQQGDLVTTVSGR